MAKNHTKRNTKTKKTNTKTNTKIKKRNVRSTKRQNKKIYIKMGGAKFGLPTEEYVLPERTYLYVANSGDEIIKTTSSQISQFDFKDKTVGVMSGCFCPPHIGHF